MNVTGPGYASLQASITSGVEAFTSGTQIEATQAAALHTAIDSFQSLNSQVGRLPANASQLAQIQEAASFADPAAFYRMMNPADAVLRELNNPGFQPTRTLQQLSDQLGKLRMQGDAIGSMAPAPDQAGKPYTQGELNDPRFWSGPNGTQSPGSWLNQPIDGPPHDLRVDPSRSDVFGEVKDTSTPRDEFTPPWYEPPIQAGTPSEDMWDRSFGTATVWSEVGVKNVAHPKPEFAGPVYEPPVQAGAVNDSMAKPDQMDKLQSNSSNMDQVNEILTNFKSALDQQLRLSPASFLTMRLS